MTGKMDKAALLNELNFVLGTMDVAEEALSMADLRIWKLQSDSKDRAELMVDVVNSMRMAESAFIEVCDKVNTLIEQVKKMEESV